jgi:hypothetical protein
MDKTVTIIYTHTDYMYLWELSFDLLKINNPTDIYIIFINKNHNSNIHNYFNYIIEYDENLNYANRLLSCLQQIEYKYVLFTHEHNIITSCSTNYITNIFNYIKNNNIVRIGLYIDDIIDSDSKKYKICDDINIIKSIYFPYSVSPSIWNVEEWIKILQKFPNKTYRTIEDDEVQKYCLNLNIFTLNYSDSIIHPKKIESTFLVNHYFQYIHLTHYGRFLPSYKHYTLGLLFSQLLDLYNLDIEYNFSRT